MQTTFSPVLAYLNGILPTCSSTDLKPYDIDKNMVDANHSFRIHEDEAHDLLLQLDIQSDDIIIGTLNKRRLIIALDLPRTFVSRDFCASS